MGPAVHYPLKKCWKKKQTYEKTNPHNIHEDTIPECIILHEKKSLFQMGENTLASKQNICEFKIGGEEKATLLQRIYITGPQNTQMLLDSWKKR